MEVTALYILKKFEEIRFSEKFSFQINIANTYLKKITKYKSFLIFSFIENVRFVLDPFLALN